MQEEIAIQLYVAKAKSLPGATDYELWLIWQHCLRVAAVPFGGEVRNPALPPLEVVPAPAPEPVKAKGK